jgi:glutathione S-transferase
MLDAVDARLFIIYGSHPCATVERAMQMKGIPYRTVELPPLMHVPIQRALFGRRTVPGLQLDGERISGSRAILRRLEEIQPEPALFPTDPARRAQVEEAERWGDEVLQDLGRRLLWPAMKRSPSAAASYSQGAKMKLPGAVTRASIPLIARGEIALNRASDEAVRADLQALPGYLDRIDGWIADGRMGGDPPNAADLQIAPTLRLLMTLEDLRPLIASRPAGQLAQRLFPDVPGSIPAGSLPSEWLPVAAAA